MAEKIEKIDINLLRDATEENYEKGRTDFGNEKGWNELYPKGFIDWKSSYRQLNAYGQQRVINKINEIIDFLDYVYPYGTDFKQTKKEGEN